LAQETVAVTAVFVRLVDLL